MAESEEEKAAQLRRRAMQELGIDTPVLRAEFDPQVMRVRLYLYGGRVVTWPAAEAEAQARQPETRRRARKQSP